MAQFAFYSRAAASPKLAAALVLGSALCLAGAFAFPFLHAEFRLELPAWVPTALVVNIRQWLIAKGRIPVGDQYLLEVIQRLLWAREYLVGLALLFFSILFPVGKIAVSGLLIGNGTFVSSPVRGHLLSALALASKWSMADVFIVGMIIVFFKAEGLHFAFEARAGVYCYAAAALLSSAAVSLIQRAHHMGREDDGQAIPDQDHLGR